jgi:hypothetical protein
MFFFADAIFGTCMISNLIEIAGRILLVPANLAAKVSRITTVKSTNPFTSRTQAR